MLTPEGQDPGAGIHPVMMRGRPGKWAVITAMIVGGAVLAVGLDHWQPLALTALGVALMAVWKVSCITTTLGVDDHAVHFSTGIVHRVRCDIRKEQIRSVTVDQSILQRLLGTGAVAVFSTGDQAEFRVDAIVDPHEVRRRLTQGLAGGGAP